MLERCVCGQLIVVTFMLAALLPDLGLGEDGKVDSTAASPEGVVAILATNRFRAAGQIKGIQLSADGKILLTQNGSEDLRLWNVETGALVKRIACRQIGQTAAWSADGTLLAVIEPTGNLALFDGQTGQPKKWAIKKLDNESPLTIVLSPDNDALIVGFPSKLRSYSTNSGELLQEVACKGVNPMRLVFRDKGQRLGVYTKAKEQLFWKWPAGEPESVDKETISNYAQPLEFGPEGMKVRASGGSIFFHNSGGGLEQINSGKVEYASVAMSQDGSVLCGGDRLGNIRLWRTVDKREIHTLPNLGVAVDRLSLSADGSVLAAGSTFRGNRVRLWRINRGSVDRDEPEEILPDNCQQAGILSLQFGRGGDWMLSTSIDNTARIWDMRTRKQIARFERGYEGSLSSNARMLSLRSLNGPEMVEIYELGELEGDNAPDETPSPVRITAEGHDGPLAAKLRVSIPGTNPSMSPDGNRVATVRLGKSERLEVRDTVQGTQFKDIPAVRLVPFSAHWRAQGLLLVCGDGKRNVVVWNCDAGKTVLEAEGADGHVVALSADGAWLVTGPKFGTPREGRSVQVWNIAAGKLTSEFGEGDLEMKSAIVLRDNRRVLVGDIKGGISVWEMSTGKLLKKITAHSAGVYALALSPNGTHFVSGCMDGSIWLWDAKVLPNLP